MIIVKRKNVTRTETNGKMTKAKAHPGFKAVANSISHKEHISKKSANAILANANRHASAKAKKHNPRLNKVKK